MPAAPRGLYWRLGRPPPHCVTTASAKYSRVCPVPTDHGPWRWGGGDCEVPYKGPAAQWTWTICGTSHETCALGAALSIDTPDRQDWPAAGPVPRRSRGRAALYCGAQGWSAGLWWRGLMNSTLHHPRVPMPLNVCHHHQNRKHQPHITSPPTPSSSTNHHHTKYIQRYCSPSRAPST
jgi:hypothetical protein